MANKNLFSSVNATLPRANAVNEAGGAAYAFEAKHALAQLAATGCFNGVFYAIAGALFSFFLLGLAVIYFAVAAGFYWIVLRPNRFEVNLCDVYGSTDEVAFRSQDHKEAEEVATTVADATGLFYKPAQ